MSRKLERNLPFVDRKASNLRETAIRNHHKTNSSEQSYSTQLWVTKIQKDTSVPIGMTGLSFAQQVARNRYAIRNIPSYDNASIHKVIRNVMLKRHAVAASAVASSTVIPHTVEENDVIEGDLNGDAAGTCAVAKDTMGKNRFSNHMKIALLPTIHEVRSVQSTSKNTRASTLANKVLWR